MRAGKTINFMLFPLLGNSLWYLGKHVTTTGKVPT